VLPKAAQAVVAAAALSYRVVQGCSLAFPRLAGLGREFPKEVVARNGLAAGQIRSAQSMAQAVGLAATRRRGWRSHSPRLQSEEPSRAGCGPTTTAFGREPTARMGGPSSGLARPAWSAGH